MACIYKLITSFYIDRFFKYLLRKKLRIIMYHGIVNDNFPFDCWWLIKKSKFVKQIEYLYSNYRIISIDDVINTKILPSNACVLTFDDGYKSIYTHALPILKQKNIPFTIYLCPGPIEQQSLFWFDKVFIYLTEIEKEKDYNDISDYIPENLHFNARREKRTQINNIINHLKGIDYLEKNEILEKIIDPAIKNSSTHVTTSAFNLLSVDDVKKLAQMHQLTIGAHTSNHEILTSMPLSDAEKEISDSRNVLQDWTGKPVEHFSYPDGKFNNDLANTVKQLGFKSSTRIGLCINWQLNYFKACRLGTGSWDSHEEFCAMVSGIIPLKIELRNFLRKLV